MLCTSYEKYVVISICCSQLFLSQKQKPFHLCKPELRAISVKVATRVSVNFHQHASACTLTHCQFAPTSYETPNIYSIQASHFLASFVFVRMERYPTMNGIWYAKLFHQREWGMPQQTSGFRKIYLRVFSLARFNIILGFLGSFLRHFAQVRFEVSCGFLRPFKLYCCSSGSYYFLLWSGIENAFSVSCDTICESCESTGKRFKRMNQT